MGFAHNGDCFCDFIACEGIEGVVWDDAARQVGTHLLEAFEDHLVQCCSRDLRGILSR